MVITDGFKHDSGFSTALTKCSPNIVRFLRGLDTGKDTKDDSEIPVDFNFLTALGCLQTDGDGKYFRVLDFYNSTLKMNQHGSIRSFDEQQQLYEFNRRLAVKENIPVSVVAPEGLRGASVVFHEVSKTGAVVTNLAGGASYHNYGLAVDIVLRHFGDVLKSNQIVRVGGVLYDSFYKIYQKAGILQWASKCNLEWGGSWTDFPDVAHFQDKEYKPLPYLILNGRCLQNKANCNYESVVKYWSGRWDSSFASYKNNAYNSMQNRATQAVENRDNLWNSWKEGRGNILPRGIDNVKPLISWLFSIPIILIGGAVALFAFSRKRSR